MSETIDATPILKNIYQEVKKMALIKEYITPKGAASYWVMGLVQVDNFNKTAYVRLHGIRFKGTF